MFRVLLMVLASLVLAQSSEAKGRRYEIIDLGPGSGQNVIMAGKKIYSERPDGTTTVGRIPIRWNGQSWVDLRGFPSNSRIEGASLSGHLVGSVYDPIVSPYYQAFVWERGRLNRLPLPTGYPHSRGLGISPNGRYIVGGCSENAEDALRIFRYDTKKKRLLLLGQGVAVAVNDSGEITGQIYEEAKQSFHSFRFSQRSGMELIAEGGSRDIGPSGTIVGFLDQGSMVLPFRQRRGQQPEVLGLLTPKNGTSNSFSEAWAINQHGEIVGSSSWQGFYWSRATGIVALDVLINDPSWEFYGPMAINDLGWIVGNGTLNGTPYRKLLIKPIHH